MTSRRLRAALVASAAFVSASAAVGHAHAQWIVFDPTNYSQNVLTAARTLQEVNNQIQSLENQAKMLVNQAKNLESLPYSSLTQLQQSISQTEQLLSQAQRVAYSVSSINQAFTQTYPQSYSGSTSFSQLVAGAQARWQNSLSGFQDAMRVQAGVVQNLELDAHADQRADLVEPVRIRRAASRPVGQSADRAADDPACRLDGGHGGDRPGPEPGRGAYCRQSGAGAAAAHQFHELRRRLSAGLGADVPLMRVHSLEIRAFGRALGLIAIALLVILAALRVHRGESFTPSLPPAPSLSADPLARELARCRAIGLAAADDADCKAAWAENRRRFFGSSAPDAAATPQKSETTPAAKPEGR